MRSCQFTITKQGEKGIYRMRSCRQTKQGDIAGIASKFTDIFLYPFEQMNLIAQSKI